MDWNGVHFWAKTTKDANGSEIPGIHVHDHCLNAGSVAEALNMLILD